MTTAHKPPDAPKKSMEELADLCLALARPMKTGPWMHYRTGDMYMVEHIVISESTQEPMVVYRPMKILGDSHLLVRFVRPLREWQENITRQTELGDLTTPRFVRRS